MLVSVVLDFFVGAAKCLSVDGSSKSNKNEMHAALNALMTASATAMHQSSHGVGTVLANAHGAWIEDMLADPFLINADEALAIRNNESFVDKLPFKVTQNELKLSTFAVFNENLLLLHSLSKMQPAQKHDWSSSSPHNMKTGASVACCRLLTAMVGFNHPCVDEHGQQFSLDSAAAVIFFKIKNCVNFIISIKMSACLQYHSFLFRLYI